MSQRQKTGWTKLSTQANLNEIISSMSLDIFTQGIIFYIQSCKINMERQANMNESIVI